LNQYYLKPEYKEILFAKIPVSKERNSVILTKKPAKNIQEFFTLTSFRKDEWPYSTLELEHLLNQKILFFIEEEGNYLLTFKGLIILEYNLEFSNELDSYLNDLNSLLFDKNLKKKYESLKLKNKVILLTLIGLCAFSPNFSLYIDESNKSEFAESADFSVELLKKYNQKNVSDLDKIWNSNIVGEGSILSSIRRLDDIPKQTGNIFKVASRDKTHGIFVDILNSDGSIDKNKALFLLRKIFDNKILDMNQKQELIESLNNIQNNYISLIHSNGTIDRINVKIQLRDMIFEEF